MADTPKWFQSGTQSIAAVVGENTVGGDGVFGMGHGASGRGVVGTSDEQNGVTGVSQSKTGGAGVWGAGDQGTGVFGISNGGTGVVAQSQSGRGLLGQSTTLTGVEGQSQSGIGVYGESQGFDGVYGVSNDPTRAGVSGHNKAPGGGLAGYFDGTVTVTRDLTVQGDIFVPGADCAEEFDISSGTCPDPGTVMIIDDVGAMAASSLPYDKRVAGVISGAGTYRAGLILDSNQKTAGRKPIALVGKVFCKADAGHGAIKVGDLLTTSPTPGHAMKAEDVSKAFGAVIGKAMKPLASGKGLIPILIALQ